MQHLLELMGKPFEYGTQLLNGITIPFLNISAFSFLLAVSAAEFGILIFRFLLGLNIAEGAYTYRKNIRIAKERKDDKQ